MHLSSDDKDLLNKCTILTAMIGRLTRLLFGHTFRKLAFQVNTINQINEARDVSNAQADLSLRHSHVL